jgi:hypothetical protein
MSIQQNFPSTRPSLNLNFARSQKLDPRITFTRTSSATRVNSDGLIEVVSANSPRFDFDPISGESLGLLIEESRTNLFKNSSVPCNDGRAVTDVVNGIDLYTITANAFSSAYNSATSPGNSGFMPVQQGLEYVVSFYAKKVDTNTVTCRLVNSTGGLLTGTGYAAPTFDGGRVSVKLTCTVSGSAQLFLGMSPGLSVEFGGLQIEAGSFPTSYIPTSGSAVTRSADTAQITGTNFSSWYNQSEGSFYSDMKLNPSFPVSGKASISFTLSDKSFNNRITLASSTGSSALNADVTISGTVYRAVIGNYTSGSSSIRTSIGYKSADTAGSFDGASPVTSSPSGTLPLLTRADIGKDHTNFNHLSGHIRRITYYPRRLANAQLQTLTK